MVHFLRKDDTYEPFPYRNCDDENPFSLLTLEIHRHNTGDSYCHDVWFLGCDIASVHAGWDTLPALEKACRIVKKAGLASFYSGSALASERPDAEATPGDTILDALKAMGIKHYLIADGKDTGWHSKNRYADISPVEASRKITRWIESEA